MPPSRAVRRGRQQLPTSPRPSCLRSGRLRRAASTTSRLCLRTDRLPRRPLRSDRPCSHPNSPCAANTWQGDSQRQSMRGSADDRFGRESLVANRDSLLARDPHARAAQSTGAAGRCARVREPPLSAAATVPPALVRGARRPASPAAPPSRSPPACAPAPGRSPRRRGATGMIFSPFFTLSGISARSFSFSFGMNTVLMPAAQRRQQLLLQPADRQHPPAQRDLAGHGHVAAHRDAGQHRDDGGRHRDAGRRTVLGVAPSGTWTWMSRFSKMRRLDAEAGARGCGHRTSPPATISCITSPSLPVVFTLPLPGSSTASIGQHLAADLGPGQAGDDADHILGLGLAVAELPHAGILARGSCAVIVDLLGLLR